MNLKQAVRMMLAAKHTSAKEASEAMGRSSNYLTAILARPGVRIDTICEIVDTLGYEVVLRPKRVPSTRAEDDLVLEYVSRKDEA